eukprot:GFUD01012715.1.p1 GENE.GFUD01012715.1~~GFUD01012715.1.p1  ORF type:complete len:422 (+),score=81.87 GFUD01012715.1:188-1453(+)
MVVGRYRDILLLLLGLLLLGVQAVKDEDSDDTVQRIPTMDTYIRAQNLIRKIESMSGDVERSLVMVLINVLSHSLSLAMAELIKTQEMDISQLEAIHITGVSCGPDACGLTCLAGGKCVENEEIVCVIAPCCPRWSCIETLAKTEGESCGYCLCPPTYSAGECEEGLTCVHDPNIADAPGICEKKGVSCTSYPTGHTMTVYAGPSKECAAKTLVKGFSQAGKELLVKTHNELRQKVAAGLETNGNQPKASNMRKISWNEELAEIAQRWVDQCIFGHDEIHNLCDGTSVGQNAFLAFDRSEETQDEVMAKVDKPVTAWYAEVEIPFDSSLINPFKWTGGDTGHYTQVVWADSHQVGCGMVNYKDGDWYKTIITCNYAVGGNMVGSTMYKVGEGCSDCPAGTTCDSTFDKLCATTTTTTSNSK